MRTRLSLLILLLISLFLGAQAAAQPETPAFITSFEFPAEYVAISRQELEAGAVRLPVTWSVQNRPENSNLVFEQIMPDGSFRNVELPRVFILVPSSGEGSVAPVVPEGEEQVTIWLRLVDLDDSERVFDTFGISLPIRDQEPARPIRRFTGATSTIDRNILTASAARIGVSWIVDNRPANSNLVFEQLFGDDSFENNELPRDFTLVPSQGDGIVAPRLPANEGERFFVEEEESIRIRLRLVDLDDPSIVHDSQLFGLAIGEAAAEVGNITSFSTTATSVSRGALTTRTARIPVVWASEVRPANSNLVFEQILDNGEVINVELPRDFVFVPGSGTGTVAPLLPGGDAETVNIRLRFIDIGSDTIYDSAELALPISDEPAAEPVISRFNAISPTIRQDVIEAGDARISVSWNVENRPLNSNLVFEQVMPDGSVVNVELPRNFILVPSQGDGVVAPRFPGEGISDIPVQVRLIDLSSQTVYDTAELTLQVLTAPSGGDGATAGNPSINDFSLVAFNAPSGLTRSSLEDGTARITVHWDVERRPAGSNLVFEQIMPDGRAVNVELPRDFTIIPSEGQGAVAPRSPAGSGQVTLRMRLIDLTNNSTLISEEMQLPIIGNAVTGQTCLADSYRPDNGLAIAVVGRAVTAQTDARLLPNYGLVYSSAITSPQNVVGNLADGDQFTVIAGPTCYQVGEGIDRIRMWRIRMAEDGSEGWVREYYIPGEAQTIYYIEPVGDAPPPSDDTTGDPLIEFFGLSDVTSDSPPTLSNLEDGTARVNVRWDINGRPDATNLVFEQIMPDGSIVNVELPRDVAILPSEGRGDLAPVLPEGSNQLIFQMRLIHLADSRTLLTSESVAVPIIFPTDSGTTPVISGSECLAAPYAAGNGLEIGASARVNPELETGPMMLNAVQGESLGNLNPGASVTILEGPACFQLTFATNNQSDFRHWRIRTEDNREGWVSEYSHDVISGIIYNLEPVSESSQASESATNVADFRTEVMFGDACFAESTIPANGLTSGIEAHVIGHEAGVESFRVLDAPQDGELVATLAVGDTVTVIDGPACWRYLHTSMSSQTFFRYWQVRAGKTEGWALEHAFSLAGTTHLMAPGSA